MLLLFYLFQRLHLLYLLTLRDTWITSYLINAQFSANIFLD